MLGFSSWKGTCHGDDLGYLFHPGLFQSKFEPGGEDEKVVETITKLWTDFAKEGRPTANDELWKPITKDSLPYLEIDSELKLLSNLQEEETRFWSDLYESL